MGSWVPVLCLGAWSTKLPVARGVRFAGVGGLLGGAGLLGWGAWLTMSMIDHGDYVDYGD